MNRPEGHVPVAPAWTATGLPPRTVCSMLFCRHQAETTEALKAALTGGTDQPSHLERARVANADEPTTVFLAYWTDPSAYGKWRARPDAIEATEREGVLTETATIPSEYWETLHSTDDITPGVRNLCQAQSTDVHEYWGAARDRITASSTEDLASRPGRPLPANLCLIRSGQIWAHCQSQERSIYFEQVQPHLLAGVQFLADTPSTGCLSSRFLQEQTIDGEDLESTSFVGWFTDLSALEAWAESHPTHLAIFNSFLEMVGELGGAIQLRLWHEVAVLPQGTVEVAGGDPSPLSGF